MAKADSLLVEPPSISRTRATSADQSIVASMVSQFEDGKWIGNGKTYKTYKAAGNDAQIYRRAFARAKGVQEHKVVSRIWGLNGDTVVTDKTASATWKFALSINPDRQKRSRNRATASA